MTAPGFVAGAGLLSHAPVIMFPEAVRVAANGGKDFTLATGLRRLRRDVLETTDYDTVLVLDTHWTSTTEFVVTSSTRRAGLFTSDEMPGAIRQMPYDLPGDPGFALALEAEGTARGTWIKASDDPCLPIHYGTLNLWSYLAEAGKPWVSMSVCQTATPEDFLLVGAVVAAAAERAGRRVLVVASGGLSHAFLPLSELRARMAGDPANVVSPEAREADLARIAWLEDGRHDKVVEAMPAYARFEPEGRFGHYLILAGAIGGARAGVRGERFSEYESGIGTGHVHLWFRRPTSGWAAADRA